MIRKTILSVLLGVVFTIPVNSTSAASSHEIPASAYSGHGVSGGNELGSNLIVTDLDGAPIQVEELEDRLIISKDKKTGQILKFELPAEVKSSEIIPSGKLFGKLVGTKHSNHFTFIEQLSPIEELRQLLEQKLEESFKPSSLESKVKLLLGIYHPGLKKICLPKSKEEIAKIFDSEFFSRINILLNELEEQYGTYWSIDIENLKYLTQVIVSINDMIQFLPSGRSKEFKNFYRRFMVRKRAINFYNKDLVFGIFFNISVIHQTRDTITFKISNLPDLIEGSLDGEYYLTVDMVDFTPNPYILLLSPMSVGYHENLTTYYYFNVQKSEDRIDFILCYSPNDLIHYIMDKYMCIPKDQKYLSSLKLLDGWLNLYLKYSNEKSDSKSKRRVFERKKRNSLEHYIDDASVALEEKNLTMDSFDYTILNEFLTFIREEQPDCEVNRYFRALVDVNDISKAYKSIKGKLEEILDYD